MNRLRKFCTSNLTYYTLAIIILFFLFFIFIAQNRTSRYSSKIDITKFLQFPEKGFWSYSISLQKDGQFLCLGEVYATVLKNKNGQSFVLTTYTHDPEAREVASWHLGYGVSGFTYWGEPKIRILKKGLSIPPIATIDEIRTENVVWVDKNGKQHSDICHYGLKNGPKNMYTLSYKFNSGIEFGIVISLASRLPINIINNMK